MSLFAKLGALMTGAKAQGITPDYPICSIVYNCGCYTGSSGCKYSHCCDSRTGELCGTTTCSWSGCPSC
jgi:hypothetical protein